MSVAEVPHAQKYQESGVSGRKAPGIVDSCRVGRTACGEAAVAGAWAGLPWAGRIRCAEGWGRMNEIPPNEVGRRVREIRLWRGLSLTAAAGLAGISYGYLGRLERGEQALTNRRTLEHIAQALRVAPSEFNGQPWEPGGAMTSEAHAGLLAIESALEICELGEDPGGGLREWPALEADLAKAEKLREATDYAAVCALAPRLLIELHAAYVRRPDLRPQVLVGLIRCYYPLATTAKRLGVRGLPIMMVKAAQSCAEELAAPAWIGFASWLRGIVSGAMSREQQYRRSIATADRIGSHLGDPEVAQAYGMIHLSAALAAAVQRDRSTAETHLAEAASVAARLDEEIGAFGRLWFGRTNVDVWRASIGLELGDGVAAVQRAAHVAVDAIPSPSRRANYYAEAGCALLAEPRYQDRGVELLVKAESLAPQQVRSDIFVRDAVAGKLRSARRDAAGRELRGLAWRLGIAPESPPLRP
ncbi:helix-turn-helix transcriptional regulator [Nocardia farcinica]|uniref:helix-turn-helix domain-containing protein n=3 Tax=Nocardiaceae TaxID=85025 RepID=UPI0018949216|nr:helix-turn-helix transcriptional regulator [Nocardia farcinica]MBF6189195.1 helix-turn-helix transcriptional regulator [Nocardia farcinica]MBF6311880.1 helix-turn-helix transcriptional regulator [Nocardia farcinica]